MLTLTKGAAHLNTEEIHGMFGYWAWINRASRWFLVAALVIVAVVGTIFLVTRPNDKEKAQLIMDRQIPEAIRFVLENENELNVIQKLQGRLDGIGYLIQQQGDDDVTLHVSTHTANEVKLGPKRSFAEYPDISETEKGTIYEILSAMPAGNKVMGVGSDGIYFNRNTHFGFNLTYTNTVTLVITNNQNTVSDLSFAEDSYYKQINDNWFLGIYYWQND
jgi:hypothetical protein